MLRQRPLVVGIMTVAAFIAGAMVWWLASPLVIDRTVDETFPLAASAVVPETLMPAEAEAVMAGMAKIDQEASEEMPDQAAEATAIKTGEFRDADAFHKGSGRATIYRLADGSHVLRLEDFRVTNGPDLRVLLSEHADPMSREDLQGEEYIELGGLKGNVGNQNYVIPGDVDVERQGSVVIYCKPFHVVFSVAPLD